MRRTLLALLTVSMALLATAAVAGESGMVRLWVPGNNWAFEIDLREFRPSYSEVTRDLRGRTFKVTDIDDIMIVTVVVEPAGQELTSIQYRDSSMEAQKEWPVHRGKLRNYEIGDFAFVEYIQGRLTDLHDGRQPNARVYFVRDSTCVNLHIACVGLVPGYEDRFYRVLESLKIIDGYLPTAGDYFLFGSRCFEDRDLERALGFYEQSLALEKQNRELDRNDWIELVDKLGTSYIRTGNQEKAHGVFDYGLSIEPEYPMFHYNLACYYANKQELDLAIESLGKAYQYRAHMLFGELLPNPFQDKSFRQYWGEVRFQNFVDSASRTQK